MRQTLSILIILLVSVSCSQKVVPFGLKKTINQIRKNLNDTIKYDFRIAPEDVAGIKHHFGLGLGLRNGKGLWRGSMLRTYFKLNGINHAEDMSGIILTTLHRKLNNKPINFRAQKEGYKEYWKVAKIGRDTLNRYWESKYNLVNYDSIENIYNSNFSKGRLILGSVEAWEKEEKVASGIEIKMIAKIIDRNERALKLEIIELGKSKEGFELVEKVGDTIEIGTYGAYLIPEKKTIANHGYK